MLQRILTSAMLIGGLLLASSPSVLPAEEDGTLAKFAEDLEELPKETEAGRVLAEREMARSLIQYGLRNDKPEAILVGVEILHKNPVTAAKETEESRAAAKADKQQLVDWVQQAAEMRPDDDVLIDLVERTEKALSSKSRGLAEGPKRWTVQIEKGGYFELDPRLVYNAHEKAVLSAFAEDKTILGVTVRRADQPREYARAVGQGRVSTDWNAGIYTSGWYVRIYNIAGPGTKTVRVETN